MITMDLNGITWVGHVYQKFETMCLEVEEVVCQDTVKYVENQVQAVGASVKKFYLDVMQDVMHDLLPPSSLEPGKSAETSDLPVEKYSGTLKEPNVVLKEDAVEDDAVQLMEDSEAAADVNKNAAHVPLSSQLSVVDDIIESCYSYNKKCTLNKLNIENLHVPETSSGASCVENEFCRISSFSENDNAINEGSCHQIRPTSTPASVEEDDCDSVEGSRNEIESATDSIPQTLTDGLHLVESTGKREMGMRCSSSVIESLESNAFCSCSNAGMVSIGCFTNCDIKPAEISDKTVSVPCPGQSENWVLETSRSNSIDGKEIETIEQLDKARVDESCIMVNGAEIYFHPQREGKHKPYQFQKKIRDAISSRMRSARKKEYKKLALWYGDDVKSDQDSEESSISALTREETRRSLTHDVLDSEWELL